MGCQCKHPRHISLGLYATQSQNTTVQHGLDPATQILSMSNFIVHCAWFQAACNPRSSRLPVLSNVAPSPSCKAAADSMLQIIKAHPIWPVYADVFGHPPPRLASQRPICSHMSVNTSTQWRENWSSASVVNHIIITDPTTRQPGFSLPCYTWSLMNRLGVDLYWTRESYARWAMHVGFTWRIWLSDPWALGWWCSLVRLLWPLV